MAKQRQLALFGGGWRQQRRGGDYGWHRQRRNAFTGTTGGYGGPAAASACLRRSATRK